MEIKNNNKKNKKGISKLLGWGFIKISALIAGIIGIVPLLTFIMGINWVKLDEFLARELINSYEDAYHHALKVKYESNYDKETSEKNKTKIEKEMMKEFKKILSKPLYNEVEESILVLNDYDDIDKFEYKFEYTYENEKGEYSLIVDDENDTIKLIKPYYTKTNRSNNEASGPILSDSRMYKVKRTGWNKYILSERNDD